MECKPYVKMDEFIPKKGTVMRQVTREGVIQRFRVVRDDEPDTRNKVVARSQDPEWNAKREHRISEYEKIIANGGKLFE